MVPLGLVLVGRLRSASPVFVLPHSLAKILPLSLCADLLKNDLDYDRHPLHPFPLSFHHEQTRLSSLPPIWCEPTCPCEFSSVYLDVSHFGPSTRSSYKCPDSSQNGTCCTYASRNIFDLTVAFRLERTIETNQPSVSLWPRKVQVAIFLPYPNDDRCPRRITVPTAIAKILPACTETQYISERDVPGVAERSRSELPENVREPTLSVQPERWEAEATFPQVRALG
ncbi:uncharacterized protein BT62DRAFT_798135 [Guyanagaster necrorhizus]|uniref:Uncharacterized protein n=1 Tax=Guyanagaster necrorhizus TaxID=856835 RepID=A0A9P7VFN9_9AGAR|nr:uncharacterized protein BT62DRAFT_798135 [Guyanagaster necrorhizus MCA 3950]KAG7439139.1 hypothetical protein BT62DRAFT_798135 [Guyanagaster necrorhizus MCA 3950]